MSDELPGALNMSPPGVLSIRLWYKGTVTVRAVRAAQVSCESVIIGLSEGWRWSLMPYPESLVDFLDTFGYLAVALAIAVESSGIPAPGETMLLIGAIYAATGHMNIALVIAAATAGAVAGDNLGYWAGRRLGRDFVLRHGHWVRLDEARLARGEAFFERHGDKTVFLGRFLAVLRAYAAFLAGVNRMPYGSFMLYNALGGVVWALTFGLLGYYLGTNWPLLEQVVKNLGLGSFALAGAIVVVSALVWAKRNGKWFFNRNGKERV